MSLPQEKSSAVEILYFNSFSWPLQKHVVSLRFELRDEIYILEFQSKRLSELTEVIVNPCVSVSHLYETLQPKKFSLHCERQHQFFGVKNQNGCNSQQKHSVAVDLI